MKRRPWNEHVYASLYVSVLSHDLSRRSDWYESGALHKLHQLQGGKEGQVARHDIYLCSVMGESTDLGNTFLQAHLAKNQKMYLGRGFVKPSTEVLIPRPRFYKALDRGIFQPSVEVFINLRSR